jgi:3-oxoacyl-[acyl-carrier-protein] synthase II
MTGLGQGIRRRVVVTGMGTVSKAGVGAGALWASLLQPPPVPFDGSLAHLDVEAWIPRRERRRLDRAGQLAVVAAAEAWEDAGSPTPDPTRAAAILATVYAASSTLAEQEEKRRTEGPGSVSPLLAQLASEDACTTALAIRFGLRGPSRVLIGACAGGTYAIGDAAAAISRGTCDLVLAGATQGPIDSPVIDAYRNIRLLSRSGCLRPFDGRRDGFTLAEGAAVLVLESAEHAGARGATIRGEVLGAAAANDADDLVAPSGVGIREAMQAAMADAGLTPGGIGLINAHGTGTPANDAVEGGAIAELWGPGGVPVTSTKHVTGHLMGAAGAIEAVTSLLAVEHRLIPPASFDFEADPALDVDVVHGGPRPWEPAPVLSSSAGLGGHNGTVILGPPPG